MIFSGYLTFSVLLVLMIVFIPLRLHWLEIYCIWLVAAYLKQSVTVILSNNLHWIVLTENTPLFLAEFLREVIVIPLLIVLTLHGIMGKNRAVQAAVLFFLVAAIFLNEYILWRAGAFHYVKHWGLWAAWGEAAAVVLATWLCHRLYRRILQRDLR